ncbi:MAG: segregation/condensation protein A [Verrucomicrobiae bacterium]|nr:segregation/condensation protein A [Verrucomicrobiae bacterium]
MAEYKVQFEVFEGPLDLLLYLVRKEEVDIYQVNLTRLATQFIEYIELMRQFDLDVASEFLVMAATLMYIKSRELLPVDRQVRVEEEDEEGEDPRWELVRKLVEYKKYKDAALSLQELEAQRERVFLRRAPRLHFDSGPTLPQASIFDLLGAVNGILQRFHARHEADVIEDDPWTVSGKIETIRTLLRNRSRLVFTELFAAAGSRNEVVATFLALLELIRLRQIVATQPSVFGEIELSSAPAEAALPAEVPDEPPAGDGPSRLATAS